MGTLFPRTTRQLPKITTSGQAPGIDRITGEMWKQVFRVILEYLENLMDQCLSEGFFP